jgi:hypothetical protein
MAWVLLWLIRLLHLLLVAFVLSGPFLTFLPVLLLYLVLIPFIVVHWVTNNDTCALTVMEAYLRGVPDRNTFFYNLVSPIYKLDHLNTPGFYYVAVAVLYGVTLAQLVARRNTIRREVAAGSATIAAWLRGTQNATDAP